MELADLIFVSFCKVVVALDRNTGTTIWIWKSPKGSHYPALLLDGDRLIVSLMGYTYCLDPLTGRQLWYNELPGTGTGVSTIASVRGSSGSSSRAAAQQSEEQAASQMHQSGAH